MAAHLDRAIDELQPKSSRKSDLFFKRLEIVMSIFAHIKLYEGTFRHHGKTYRDFRFYDEREWRFVPKDHAKFLPPFVLQGSYANKLYKAHLESALRQKAPLTFHPSDIRCLVVARESDIPKLVDAIGRLRTIMPARSRKLLAARIISSEQILEDF